jgi:hypothetical protein
MTARVQQLQEKNGNLKKEEKRRLAKNTKKPFLFSARICTARGQESERYQVDPRIFDGSGTIFQAGSEISSYLSQKASLALIFINI